MLKLTGHSFGTLCKAECIPFDKMYMTILHAFNSVRILDCYSDPLGWKQKIQNQQHQGNSAKQFSTNKENITVYRSVKDVTKLMSSITELGGGIICHRAFDLLLFLCFCPNPNLLTLLMSGFEGEGKKYFSVAVDSVRTNYFSLTFLWVETIPEFGLCIVTLFPPLTKLGFLLRLIPFVEDCFIVHV